MSFFTKSSVASITAKLHRTVAELEAHAEEQARQVERKTVHIAELTFEKLEHSKEVDLATKVAANIKELLS